MPRRTVKMREMFDERAPEAFLAHWLNLHDWSAGAWIALVTTLVVLTLLGGWWLRSAFERWGRRLRLAHAGAEERAAERLLERAGYQVLGRQVAQPWRVMIDAEPITIQLRVDYVVTRGGIVFVADAKTGELASSIRHPATRRQLLEYLIAYEAGGALLVNMETRAIQEVRFPWLSR